MSAYDRCAHPLCGRDWAERMMADAECGLDDCPFGPAASLSDAELLERKAEIRAAIAAGTRSAETRSKAPSVGCQSGGKAASPRTSSIPLIGDPQS